MTPTIADLLQEQGYRLEGEGDGFAVISRGTVTEPGLMGEIDLRISAIDAEGNDLRVSATVTAHRFRGEYTEAKVNFGPSTTTPDPVMLRAFAAVLTLAADRLTSLQQALAAGYFSPEAIAARKAAAE